MTGKANRRIRIGDRFGRLMVVELGEREGNGYFDLYRCACGQEKRLRRSAVMQGRIRSCGCLRKENCGKVGSSHRKYEGLSEHPLYRFWYNLMRRATNPHSLDWGRVCRRWMADYRNFLDDLHGMQPPQNSELVLLDERGIWNPMNVRWAPIGEIRRRRYLHSGFGSSSNLRKD